MKDIIQVQFTSLSRSYDFHVNKEILANGQETGRLWVGLPEPLPGSVRQRLLDRIIGRAAIDTIESTIKPRRIYWEDI